MGRRGRPPFTSKHSCVAGPAPDLGSTSPQGQEVRELDEDGALELGSTHGDRRRLRSTRRAAAGGPWEAGAAVTELQASGDGRRALEESGRQLRKATGKMLLARRMREGGIAAQERCRGRTKGANATRLIVPDLLERSVGRRAPNDVEMTAVSSRRTEEQWPHLTMRLDLTRRRVVGVTSSGTHAYRRPTRCIESSVGVVRALA